MKRRSLVEAQHVVLQADLKAARSNLSAAESDILSLRSELANFHKREAETRQMQTVALRGLQQLAAEQEERMAQMESAERRLVPLQDRLDFAVQRCTVLPQLLRKLWQAEASTGLKELSQAACVRLSDESDAERTQGTVKQVATGAHAEAKDAPAHIQAEVSRLLAERGALLTRIDEMAAATQASDRERGFACSPRLS